VDTITRREFLSRLMRATAAAPVILGTRAAQEGLILRLARLFGGRDTAIGRWLRELYFWW
jgi:hypothetical protein